MPSASGGVSSTSTVTVTVTVTILARPAVLAGYAARSAAPIRSVAVRGRAGRAARSLR